MGAASRDGKTVLLVSHNLPMITNLCHRAILLDAGTVISTGTPVEIVKLYLSRVRSAAGEVVWSSPENRREQMPCDCTPSESFRTI